MNLFWLIRIFPNNLTEDSIFLSSEPGTEEEEAPEPEPVSDERPVEVLRTGPSLGILARAYLTLINATKPDTKKVFTRLREKKGCSGIKMRKYECFS